MRLSYVKNQERLTTDVCVIGAGPAGLFAATHAALAGAETLVLEGNTMAGKKLLITGGGRCNITHAGAPRELAPVYAPFDKFLRFGFFEMPPTAVVDFFEAQGLNTRTESNGCVFPVTNQAVDVRDALMKAAQAVGVTFCFDRTVQRLERGDEGFVVHAGGHVVEAGRVILATGGCSYPRTGSRGTGYALAEALGHTLLKPRPVLVPLRIAESWCFRLIGTALESVVLSADVKGVCMQQRGPLMFTQDGIGGPTVLNFSRNIATAQLPLAIALDLIPQLTQEQLDRDLIAQCAAQSKKSVRNLVTQWLPKRVAEQVCALAGCGDDLWACSFTKVLRAALIQNLKSLKLTVVGTRPIDEAVVTRGGVSTAEIHTKTMESTRCPGLFFAGEVMDVDGPCGGYNLQICWSTGALAGRNAAG